jgi:hypothetical protein
LGISNFRRFTKNLDSETQKFKNSDLKIQGAEKKKSQFEDLQIPKKSIFSTNK